MQQRLVSLALLLMFASGVETALDPARSPGPSPVGGGRACISSALREDGRPAEDGAACLLQREGHALAAAGGQENVKVRLPKPQNLSAPEQDPSALEQGSGPLPASALPDGRGSDRSTVLQLGLGQLEAAVAERALARPVRRSKVTLMLIEMFPLAWTTGIDRFYLGSYRLGFAKLVLSLLTCGLGGLVWGLVDFCAVLANAFRKRDSMEILGMAAAFRHEEVQVAQFLAFADVLMLGVWYAAWKCYWAGLRRRKLQLALEKSKFKRSFSAPKADAGMKLFKGEDSTEADVPAATTFTEEMDAKIAHALPSK